MLAQLCLLGKHFLYTCVWANESLKGCENLIEDIFVPVLYLVHLTTGDI